MRNIVLFRLARYSIAVIILLKVISLFSFFGGSPDQEEDQHVRLALQSNVPNSRGTIFTCVSPGFYYAKHFLYNYVEEGFNVKVYHADRVPLNGAQLPVHWCRVYIMQKLNVGPVPWIYSDADTKVDVRQLKEFLPKHRNYDGFLMMNGTERRIHELRTNWFVLPSPHAPRTRAIVNAWASNAQDIDFQDQAVINNLYTRCRRGKGLQCWHYVEGPVQSKHCGSHVRPRWSCMQDMIHDNEKIKKYIKSGR